MSSVHYDRVIRQWCEATGMEAWSPNEPMHVEIEGTTVGLIYDEESMSDVLHAYLDLGPYEHADFHKRLLRKNLDIDAYGNGYFGIHPDSGSAVYRLSLCLTEDTDGAQLPQLLATAIEVARQRVQQD